MKFLAITITLAICWITSTAEAGRNGKGKSKYWYGPVSSEQECQATSRLPRVTYKTDDVATVVCKDVSSSFSNCK